jgi:hypothetical protein
MRKNILILALLLCGGLSLAAQTRPDVTIYVTPVIGNGSSTDDNTFFYRQVVQEISAQDFYLAKTQRDSDFSMIGRLDRYTLNEGQYAFRLELRDNKTGEMRVEGGLLYETPEDARLQIPFLVASLLYTIPPDPVPEEPEPEPEPEIERTDGWRNNWIYLGLAATYKPRIYVIGNNEAQTPYLGYPWPALWAEFHVANFFSFEIGAELAGDYFEYKKSGAQKAAYNNVIIEVPVLLKFVIKPGSSLMLEPYLGGFVNLPLYATTGRTKPALVSGLVGFQCGFKAGPGVLFFDLRGAMDMDFINKSTVYSSEKVPPTYQRYVLRVGLGYKFGLIQR